MFEQEYMYHWFWCKVCNKTYLFEAFLRPGFSDYEEVKCPTCATSFGEIRADEGCALVGSIEQDIGSGGAQGIFPEVFEDILTRYLVERGRLTDFFDIHL